MDCRTALQLVPFDRPRGADLDAETTTHLREHLEQCPTCGPVTIQEKRSDAWLGRAIRDVPIPAGLQERILLKLTAERDQRGRQRLLYLGLAAAAAIVLYVVAVQLRPTTAATGRVIDLTALETPLSPPPKRLEDVSPWFERHYHVGVTLPEEFSRRWNFSLVTDAQVERFGEHVVPVLIFRNKDSVAKVYFLRPDQYDAAQAAARKSTNYAEAPRPLGKPGEAIAYVVLGPQSRIDQFQEPLPTPNG